MPLRRRLKRIEDLAPHPRPALSAPWELLSLKEAITLRDAIVSGNLTEALWRQMVMTARERQAAGWTADDARRMSVRDNEKDSFAAK